jgi:hypothetical protein
MRKQLLEINSYVEAGAKLVQDARALPELPKQDGQAAGAAAEEEVGMSELFWTSAAYTCQTSTATSAEQRPSTANAECKLAGYVVLKHCVKQGCFSKGTLSSS